MASTLALTNHTLDLSLVANVRRAPFCRRAFTIWEALIVAMVVAMLLSLALPILRKSRDEAMTQQSMFNLITLSASHFMYAADHNGNQWTVTPHNLQDYGNSITTAIQSYIASVGGPNAQMIWAGNGPGYFLGGGPPVYYWVAPAGPLPLSFTSAQTGFGHHRMHNLPSFNAYVGGKFYDSTFYAPKDVVPINSIGVCLDAPELFCTLSPWISRSSYGLSPAALFTPELWSVHEGKFPQSDDAIFANWPTAFQTPTFSQIAQPDLKTHLMEHHWLQHIRPGTCNPDPVPGWITPPVDGCQPYMFTHSIDSAPTTLFYDGHVRLLPNSEVQQHEKRVELWRRDTAFGPAGYFLDHAADRTVDVSHHILTIDGALGRDTLGPIP